MREIDIYGDGIIIDNSEESKEVWKLTNWKKKLEKLGKNMKKLSANGRKKLRVNTENLGQQSLIIHSHPFQSRLQFLPIELQSISSNFLLSKASPTLPSEFIRVSSEPDTSRHEIIKKIEALTRRKLISYISNFDAPIGNVIDHHDITILNDILTLLEFPNELDIIIHSPGGTVESTQKIVSMLRDKVTSLRVIVPEAAKSAATLLSFASNEILMSYMSELGPIDPQVLVGFDPTTRQPIYRPAWSVIHSLDNLEEELKKGRDRNIVGALIQQINPLLLDVAQKAISYSRSLAQEWLIKYMKLEEEKAKDIANYFSDLKTHLSHGRVINYKDAQDQGLRVTKLEETSELWKSISELHLRAKMAMAPPRVKIFDCEKHSYFHQIISQPLK